MQAVQQVSVVDQTNAQLKPTSSQSMKHLTFHVPLLHQICLNARINELKTNIGVCFIE